MAGSGQMVHITPAVWVWRTKGRIGYINPAACKVPNASSRGTKSIVADKLADWLHNCRRLTCPQCLKAGDKISNGLQVGGWAAKTTAVRWGGGGGGIASKQQTMSAVAHN